MKSIYFQISENEGISSAFTSDLSSILNTLKNGNYVLKIEKEKSARSISQNRLMWMWFNCISNETGTPIQYIHDYYISLFLRRVIEINGRSESVISGTSKLDTKEFTEFLERIQADASSELGIILPSPEDMHFVEFMEKYK